MVLPTRIHIFWTKSCARCTQKHKSPGPTLKAPTNKGTSPPTPRFLQQHTNQLPTQTTQISFSPLPHSPALDTTLDHSPGHRSDLVTLPSHSRRNALSARASRSFCPNLPPRASGTPHPPHLLIRTSPPGSSNAFRSSSVPYISSIIPPPAAPSPPTADPSLFNPSPEIYLLPITLATSSRAPPHSSLLSPRACPPTLAPPWLSGLSGSILSAMRCQPFAVFGQEPLNRTHQLSVSYGYPPPRAPSLAAIPHSFTTISIRLLFRPQNSPAPFFFLTTSVLGP